MKAPTPRAIVGIARTKGRDTAEAVATRYGTRTEIVVAVWASMRAPNAPAPAGVPPMFDAKVQAALLGARVLARDYNTTPKPVTIPDLQVGRRKPKRKQNHMGTIVGTDIRRAGRPPVGDEIKARIPAEHMAIIDQWVRDRKASSRSDAIRMMVEKALAPFACTICGENHTDVCNGCPGWLPREMVSTPDSGPWRMKERVP